METSRVQSEVMKLKKFQSTTKKRLIVKEITLKQYNELFHNELSKVASELKMDKFELGCFLLVK